MSKFATRHEYDNTKWKITVSDNGDASIESIKAFVLMDILHELRILNRLLSCPNFIDIPRRLNEIVKHTKPKPKPKRRIEVTQEDIERGERV